MKINVRRVLVAMLALLLVLSLTACGGEKDNDKQNSDAGYYIMTSLTMDGETYGVDDMKAAGLYGEAYIELREDKTGTIRLGFDEETHEFTWEPGVCTTADGEKVKYTLKGDELTISEDGETTMVFTRSEKGSGGDDNKDNSNKGGSVGGETISMGGCTAVFKGYELLKDTLDYDVLRLTYDFTNGSDVVHIFGFTFPYTATQAGEELYESYGEDVDGKSLNINGDVRLQPGETVEIQFALELKNTEDDVILEFADLSGEEHYTQTIHLSDAETSEPGNTSGKKTDIGSMRSSDDYWSGDWYGWWLETSAYGSWEESDGVWSDCCATITMDDDTTGTIMIWDEIFTKDEPLAECKISFGSGTTAAGAFMSEDGLFIDAAITHADWIIDPGTGMVSQYDHMICIEGTYEDPEDDGGFDYRIYLRPWGMDWEDVAADDAEMMPENYANWYLPMIQSGENMPDEIGG